MEIWKPVVGYEGLYEVSNIGNVKSLPKKRGYVNGNEKIIRPFRNDGGYLLVSLSKNNKMKHYQVHRLVAQAFIPNLKNKPQVDHISRIRDDNRVENLRWVSVSENGNNTCLNSIIEYKGQKRTVSEWSRILGIKQVTLHRRLFYSNWSVEKAFNTPVKSKTEGKTEKEMLLDYLCSNEYITNDIAKSVLGIKNFHPRISSLRKDGFLISKHKTESKEIRYFLKNDESEE